MSPGVFAGRGEPLGLALAAEEAAVRVRGAKGAWQHVRISDIFRKRYIPLEFHVACV